MCGFWKAEPQEHDGSDADHPPALAARLISADRATFASRKSLQLQKNQCETTFAFSLKIIGKINRSLRIAEIRRLQCASAHMPPGGAIRSSILLKTRQQYVDERS
jgi:hypothetical protein